MLLPSLLAYIHKHLQAYSYTLLSFCNVNACRLLSGTALQLLVQILGVAQIPLADADFIVNPAYRCPVAVDLIKPESAGLAKFVGGGVQGVTKVGKAGTGMHRPFINPVV